MGMNKKFRVAFDVTATLSDEQEASFNEHLKKLAKCPRSQREDYILVQALTYGPEGALEAVVRGGLREALKEFGHEVSTREVTMRLGPAEVRVKS